MTTTTFTRVPMQFIAALGDPGSCEGTGVSQWGLWRVDPGPRGVSLQDYEMVKAMGGFTPAGWTFDAGRATTNTSHTLTILGCQLIPAQILLSTVFKLLFEDINLVGVVGVVLWNCRESPPKMGKRKKHLTSSDRVVCVLFQGKARPG